LDYLLFPNEHLPQEVNGALLKGWQVELPMDHQDLVDVPLASEQLAQILGVHLFDKDLISKHILDAGGPLVLHLLPKALELAVELKRLLLLIWIVLTLRLFLTTSGLEPVPDGLEVNHFISPILAVWVPKQAGFGLIDMVVGEESLGGLVCKWVVQVLAHRSLLGFPKSICPKESGTDAFT
jgi:hypothetical protein